MSATTEPVTTVPAHVPPELVWEDDFDAFAAEGEDPFLAMARLHDGPGIIWATNASAGQPGWVLTRHDVISDAFSDPEHFTADRGGIPVDFLGTNLRLNPIEFDPPDHQAYRRNLNPLFTPSAIKAMSDAVRRTCGELISRFEDRGGCEFTKEFAQPFPSYIFLDLMDLPREKLGQFLEWEETMLRSPNQVKRGEAGTAIFRYLDEHLTRQREHPTNALNRAIASADFNGRPLDHIETMGMYCLLYLGGLDTVYNTLGWVMRHLATHPDDQQRLREDFSLIPAAVEEFARAYSVAYTGRKVAKDCTFHGVEMKAGEEVNLPISLANRDPRVFADPHRVDIGRKPRHINFGTGAHVCLGIHLAKRELQIVIEEFLRRFRDIRIKDGETYRFHTGRHFGVDYLPLVWEKA